MTSIHLQGILRDSLGEIDVGAIITFTHMTTTGETIASTKRNLLIPPNGAYSIDVEYGQIRIDYTTRYTERFVSMVIVNQDSTATSLPELLNAAVPVTPAVILEMQAILADAVAASDTSEAFANQLTTFDLIGSAATFAPDTNITTKGYLTSGDGGSGSWVQNGVTGQTPSQSPSQLGGALLNDGNGNQWRMVAKNNEVSASAFGVVGDGITDDTLACNAAGSTNYIIDISGMTPYVTDKISFNYIKGNSVTDSYFKVDASFNMLATAILKLTKVDGSVIHGGVGVVCEQPNVSLRASLNQYPWALDFESISRSKIGAFRCSSAWNGVNALGNTGGTKIGTMEIGAFNEGLNTDGALDFWHADTLHFWPFGITAIPNALNDIYYDGTTVGARFGKTDGLDIKTLSSFRTRVITEAGSGIGPFGCIGTLQCDGSDAWLNFNAGHVTVANFYSTSAKDGDRAIAVSGGQLTIGAHDITPFANSTLPTPYIESLGGNLVLNGGISRATMPNAPNYKCSSGAMMLGPVEFDSGNDVARSIGFIAQTGGRMTCNLPRFKDKATGIGDALTVTGGTWSTFNINEFLGWDYTIPATLGTNTYNLAKTELTTPTVRVAAIGDFLPSYSIQDCSYTLKDNYVDFSLDISFDTNAYVAASGLLTIETGIPHLATIEAGADIRTMSNVAFSSVVFISGEVRQATSGINVRNSTSGAPDSSLLASAVPANGTGYRFVISGRYKAA